MSSPPFRSLNLSTWLIRSQTGFCKILLNVWMKTDKSGTWARFSSTTIPAGSDNWYTRRIAGSYEGKAWKNWVIFSYLSISVKWVMEFLKQNSSSYFYLPEEIIYHGYTGCWVFQRGYKMRKIFAWESTYSKRKCWILRMV